MSKSVELARLIWDRIEGDRPEFGLILGSGLGHLSDAVKGVAIPYKELPDFPHAGVSGHDPRLVIGDLEGVRVVALGGRSHYYETGRADAMRLPLEVLAALGVQKVILTNAAGAVNTDLAPGDLILLNDHIAFAGTNPLIGETADSRFVPLTEAYDPDMRTMLQSAAVAEKIDLREGVYGWFSGPSFETPAEIRAARVLGMDVVGMSTVPEVILSRFFGLRCAAISVITNMGAGLSDESISHEHTKQMAPLGAAKLEKILRRFLRDYAV